MPKPAKSPRRGEVWWVDLEPVRGHEQGRKRPCLIASVDEFNEIPHGLVWVVPITTNLRAHSFTVPVNPPEGGLKARGMILCHQLRTISVDRLERRAGSISAKTFREVHVRLGLILGI